MFINGFMVHVPCIHSFHIICELIVAVFLIHMETRIFTPNQLNKYKKSYCAKIVYCVIYFMI